MAAGGNGNGRLRLRVDGDDDGVEGESAPGAWGPGGKMASIDQSRAEEQAPQLSQSA